MAAARAAVCTPASVARRRGHGRAVLRAVAPASDAPAAAEAEVAVGLWTAQTEGGNPVLLEVRELARKAGEPHIASTGGYIVSLAGGTLTPLRPEPVPKSVWAAVTPIKELADELNSAVERPPLAATGGVPSSLVGMSQVHTYEEFRGSVEGDAQPWCDGSYSRWAAGDATAAALLPAGELAALRSGERGVVLLQAFNGASSAPSDVHAPYALRALEEAAGDDDVGVLLSVAQGADGDIEGFTLVLYADKAPFDAYAGELCRMGVQAASTAQGAYYKALVGGLLGYSKEEVAAHVAQAGEELSAEDEVAVAEALRGVSAEEPSLPWRDGVPRAKRGGFGKKSLAGLAGSEASKGPKKKKRSTKNKTFGRCSS